MSLIQEALRRQQEESGKTPPEATPPPFQQPAPPVVPLATKAPSAKTPMSPPAPIQVKTPPPPTEAPAKTDTTKKQDGDSEKDTHQELPPAKSNTKPWSTLAGIVALILILVGGGSWMLIHAFQQWQTRTPSEPTPLEQTTPEDKTTEVIPEVTNTTVPLPDITTPATNNPATNNPATNNPATITPVAKPTKPAVVEKQPVDWPYISLTGLVGKGANGSVIINGERVSVGQTIEEATLVKIERRGAWLRYEGEKKFFRIESNAQ